MCVWWIEVIFHSLSSLLLKSDSSAAAADKLLAATAKLIYFRIVNLYLHILITFEAVLCVCVYYWPGGIYPCSFDIWRYWGKQEREREQLQLSAVLSLGFFHIPLKRCNYIGRWNKNKKKFLSDEKRTYEENFKNWA